MTILDLVESDPAPKPWTEGDNIPWHEPGFSQRMLAEHLSQEHDAASRRLEKIDQHVRWIHQELLEGKASKILDLACGPGLYANRLARLGHAVHGIDYAPAAIRHARAETEKDSLNCTYTESDIRHAEYGGPHDLALLIYGEFNIFKPADASMILEKIHRALKPGGLLLLEPQSLPALERVQQEPPVWRTYRSGLFSDRPHLFLREKFWEPSTKTTTTRYWIVDAATAEVNRYASSAQGYSDTELEDLLARHGFEPATFYLELGAEEHARPQEPETGRERPERPEKREQHEHQERQEFYAVTATRR